jgi:UDP-2,4-diacetamido-2,4,6-trideoxy-beta-L-altropyranose hydrolase
MKLVCRADASPSIGAGHVMRVTTLAAEAAARGHEAELHSRNLPATLRRRAESRGVTVVEVIADEPRGEAKALAKSDADVVCIDGYTFGPELFREIRRECRTIMAVDDNREMPLGDVDVIVNPNPHAGPDLYADLHPGQLLVGSKFALVRDDVTSLRSIRHTAPDARRVLVSMGGTDPTASTVPIVEMLVACTDLLIGVASGIDGPLSDACRGLASEHPERVAATAGDELPAALARSDIAVLAGGTTLWEAATLGVPTVAVVVAENQLAPACAAAEQGALILSDARRGCDADSVTSAVLMLTSDRERRLRMTRAGQELVDGHGRTRVVRALEEPSCLTSQ